MSTSSPARGDSPEQNGRPAGGAGDRTRWRALTVCLVAAFMTLLDVSIVNVALPSIRTGLHMSQSGLQWVLIGLGGTILAVQHWPGREVGWATALPLLLAGVGSGLVVSPNQALTLSEVPVVRAGSAGAVLQTGQRIGSAIGIAAVGSVFFSAVASTRGDWSESFLHGIVVVAGFVFLALIAAAVDVFGKHKPDNKTVGNKTVDDETGDGR